MFRTSKMMTHEKTSGYEHLWDNTFPLLHEVLKRPLTPLPEDLASKVQAYLCTPAWSSEHATSSMSRDAPPLAVHSLHSLHSLCCKSPSIGRHMRHMRWLGTFRSSRVTVSSVAHSGRECSLAQ